MSNVGDINSAHFDHGSINGTSSANSGWGRWITACVSHSVTSAIQYLASLMSRGSGDESKHQARKDSQSMALSGSNISSSSPGSMALGSPSGKVRPPTRQGETPDGSPEDGVQDFGFLPGGPGGGTGTSVAF